MGRKLDFITTKSVFRISLLVVALTILSVWLFGLGSQKTLIENSFLSTTILSVGFFLFVSIGLYRGIKLRDNIGDITSQFDHKRLGNVSEFASGDEVPAVGDGIEGIIISILLWILVTIVLAVLLWVFAAIVWMSILVFMAMLYWVFFRALRLVFMKSRECRGVLDKSILYGLGYTAFYTSWIYALIFSAAYFGA